MPSVADPSSPSLTAPVVGIWSPVAVAVYGLVLFTRELARIVAAARGRRAEATPYVSDMQARNVLPDRVPVSKR